MFKSQKTIKISTNDIQNRSKPRKKKENKKHNISHEISNRNKPTLPITTSTTTLANFQTSHLAPKFPRIDQIELQILETVYFRVLSAKLPILQPRCTYPRVSNVIAHP